MRSLQETRNENNFSAAVFKLYGGGYCHNIPVFAVRTLANSINKTHSEFSRAKTTLVTTNVIDGLLESLKKASVYTVVCILSQILATVLTTSNVVPQDYPRVFSFVDASLFVQASCTVLCFEYSTILLRDNRLKNKLNI